MRLKKQPAKPRRKRRTNTVYIYYGESVADLVDRLKEADINLFTTQLRIDRYSYDSQIVAEYEDIESEIELQKRMDVWETKMVEYKKWKKQNYVAIEEELKKRELKKKEALRVEKAKHATKIAKHEARIAQLDKNMARV